MAEVKRSFHSDVDVTFEVAVRSVHQIRVVNEGGHLSDRLTIFVDRAKVYERKATFFSGLTGKKEILVDGYPFLVTWSISLWRPTRITLWDGHRQVGEHCGKEPAHYRLRVEDPGLAAPSAPVEPPVHVEEAGPAQEYTKVVEREEFPLDNRHGNEVLTVEHELVKTVANEVQVGTTKGSEGGLGLQLLNLVQFKMGAQLSRQTGHAFGETITRRQTLRFSAGPGKAVVYMVVWKRKIREGACTVRTDKETLCIPYSASFDLHYEVTTREAT